MEFRQMRYFIEVAKREHMTEAAEALHVAQSAISRQITNLEAELGVDLFVREGRQVRLTPMGRVFLGHAETILLQVEQAKQEISEFLNPEQGQIQIGFPSSLAIHTLPLVIAAFREHHSQIHFQLHQGSYDQLIRMITKGEINLAFIAPVPMNHPRLNGSILFSEKIGVLLPTDHPLAHQHSLHLFDLQDESFLLFPEGYRMHQLTMQACQRMGFTPQVVFTSDNLDTLKGLVTAGLGICLLPEVALTPPLPPGCKKLPLKEPELNRSVGMIHSNQRQLPPSEQLFWEFTRQFFSRLNPFRT